jgi:hypothetical protein
LYADGPGIEKIIKEFDASTKAIKEELLRICWHMRGGISYSESHMLTAEERTIINKIIEGNIETTKTTGLNFF